MKLIKDIRFWIVLFFAIHIATITLPPFEPGSTWRQTDGLMIARNFYEISPNIFYPRVDVGGEKTGILGCEFPLLNYLIYLISLPFGFESWYGRLINLIVSSFGIFTFYKLITTHFNERSAFVASFLVLISLWFTYNRTNIPDTFGASLCLIALYCCLKYFETLKIYWLLFYFGLGLLGCLSKISAACLLTVLAIPVFIKRGPLKPKLLVCLFSSVILLSVYGWYFIWVPHLNQTYGFEGHFFMGMSISEGYEQLLANWPATLKRFYDTPFKYTGFIAFLFGMYLVIAKKKWVELTVFSLPFIAYLIVILKTGANFHINPYYVIMMIPPMAFIIGTGFAQIRKEKIATIMLLVVGIEGISNQVHVLYLREPYKSLTKLEAAVDKVSDRNDLIAISGNSNGDPTYMYAAHRRGWSLSNQELSDSVQVNLLKTMGCKYIVIVRKQFGELEIDYPKVYNSEYFWIYKISK